MNKCMKMITSAYMRESRYKTINIKEKIIKKNRIVLVIVISIVLIVVDQIVKFIISNELYNSTIAVVNGVLNFTYVENTGGAFGIGSDSTIIFVIVNIIIICIIAKFILSKKNNLSYSILVSLSLILAGGVGNLIDRVFRGFVIDYIDINPMVKYPIFNIADICVVMGCIGIAIYTIVTTIKER